MRNRLLKLLADNRGVAGRRFEVKPRAADATEAEILLYDAIVDTEAEASWWGGVSAEGFVKALRDIGAETDVRVRINSPGGGVFAGRAIEAALREHKGKVTVMIDGRAASAASFIAMAGDEIVMGRGSMMMIHKAMTIAYGNADELVAVADLLTKIDGTLAQTYADRSGRSASEFAALMAAETWFTATEAVEAGLADRVADESPKASIDWNLSAFENAPAQSADTGNLARSVEALEATVKDLQTRLQTSAQPAPAPVAESPDTRDRQHARLRVLKAIAPPIE